ncbi:MAG: ribbon-helix-helix protein, CopG family [Candidatus Nanopelagicales bacterium]|nr:ribbon-helix-helix protein, CopG family [Candidatus Nanopelagicales bacterium]
MTTTDVWQARLGADSERFDAARKALGLSRSEAIRRALVYLEHAARQEMLARDYDAFYGPPSSETPVENSIVAK